MALQTRRKHRTKSPPCVGIEDSILGELDLILKNQLLRSVLNLDTLLCIRDERGRRRGGDSCDKNRFCQRSMGLFAKSKAMP